MPFVHSKLANANFHIEAVVAVDTDVALPQVLPDHVLVDGLAALDLSDQPPTSLGKLSQKVLIPHVLVRIAALGSFSRSDAHEDSHFSTRPLADDSLIQSLGSRIEVADAIVVKHGLTDLDRLEGKADRTSGTARLPDLAIKLGR
jgi:hypothetical protein